MTVNYELENKNSDDIIIDIPSIKKMCRTNPAIRIPTRCPGSLNYPTLGRPAYRGRRRPRRRVHVLKTKLPKIEKIEDLSSSEEESEELKRNTKEVPVIPDDAFKSIDKEFDEILRRCEEGMMEETKPLLNNKTEEEKLDEFFEELANRHNPAPTKKPPVPPRINLLRREASSPNPEEDLKTKKRKLSNLYKRLSGDEVGSKQKNEMEKEWIEFNNSIFKETKPYTFLKSFDPFVPKRYAPLSSIGESLLNNEEDKRVQKVVQKVKNDEKSLVKRLEYAEQKIIGEMMDNFEETNNHLITPQYLVGELLKVKNRVARTEVNPSEDGKCYVSLTNYCVNNYLVTKIEELYRNRYGYQQQAPPVFVDGQMKPGVLIGLDFGFRMDKGKLLSILDFLLNKYRCLADDRKILDQVDEVGDEMAETIKEYSGLRQKIDTYSKFTEKVQQIRVNLADLTMLSRSMKDEKLVKSAMEIDYDVIDKLEELEKSINREEIAKLEEEAKKCQAKFNYYQKMANEIINRVEVMKNMGTMRPPVFTIPNQAGISPGLIYDDLNGDPDAKVADFRFDCKGTNSFLSAGHNFGINTVGQSLKNANLQLRGDPPIPKVPVGPWFNSPIQPDVNRKTFKID